MSTPDLATLAPWLEENIPGFAGPVSAEKIAGGQSNPTFLLTAASGRMVLRRKPPGELLKSAHAVDREFRVQKALAGTTVPVPRMLALCEDESVVGSIFYVMEHADGRTFDDPSLPDATPAERGAIYAELARVLAAIHTVDVAAVGLSDYGRPGNYFARQLDRWTRQYRASAVEPLTGMEELIAWLGSNLPADDGRVSLVHGDYRMDNLMFEHSAPRCLAVLDWELSTLGHPFADLASLLMQWRMPQGALGRGLEGVDRADSGLPSDEAFVEAYARHAGVDGIHGLNVFIAFAFFRMAAILEGVRRRGLDGNAADPERAEKLGSMVPLYVERGLEARDG